MPRKSVTQQSREAASFEGRFFTSTEPREALAELIYVLMADWETQFGHDADLGHELARAEHRRHGARFHPTVGKQKHGYKAGG